MKTKTVWMALLAIGLAGGFSAPAADFNADNFDDLVVGIPAKDLGPLAGNAGSVNVLYGSYSYGIANGLQNLTQTSTLIDTAEEDDFFGFALAVGDFNCDGHQDVAIGAKDEDLGSPSIVGAGMVHVVYGSDDGLDPAHSMMVFQGPAILEIPETYDGFGYALAAGDFDRDRCDDLAISAPYEDIGEPPVSGAGIVHVLYGSSSGLSVVGNQIWNQEDLTGLEVIEPGDYFGMALAAADFNRDSYTDLAIGAPGETIYRGEIMHAGVIHVAMGSESGLTGVNDDLIWQDDPEGSGNGAPETGDYFGSVLAVGNFNCDDFADLAVGIPFEDTTDADAGAIQIIYGGVSGMGVVSGDNLFTRDRLTPGVGDPGDHFGWALAAGDFDSQGCDDLAIGVPDVDFATVNAVGVVYVMDGQPDGLSPLDYQGLAQAPFGLGGEMEADDRLGYSLAAGNFNGDNFADLAIGVPYEDADHNTPQTHDAGAIHVVYGGLHGLNGSGSQYLYEGAPNIGGIAEADDRYGETLAAVINGYWWRAFLPLTID